MDSETITAWPRHKLLQALSSGELKPEEVITALNIHTKVADIGPEALSFVYRRTDGVIVIVTSYALSPTAGSRFIMHELYHIIKHLPNIPRIVGVNMMDEQFEEEADGFVGSDGEEGSISYKWHIAS